MIKISVIAFYFLVCNLCVSQEKLIDLHNSSIEHKIQFVFKTENISAVDYELALGVLKSNPLNSDFIRVDSTSISFKHQLIDHTNLNLIKNNVQSTVTVFGGKINFFNSKNIKDICIQEKIGFLFAYISDLDSEEKVFSLENFLFMDDKFYLVDSDIEAHSVFIIYDISLGEFAVKEKLRSQNKTIITVDEISKYY